VTDPADAPALQAIIDALDLATARRSTNRGSCDRGVNAGLH
jgi:hypothetical protein